MPGPNFFVIGAAKSGTTALYHALRRHESVFLSEPKEPGYYAYVTHPEKVRHLHPDLAAARRSYAQLYAGVGSETAIGDASTSNLVLPGTAAAIARDVPAARIVAILRHPVDRAFSHWSHFRAAGADEIADFAEAVRQEGVRQAAGRPFTYQYLGWSRYSEQLPQFLEHFGRDRVLVHLYDDFRAAPERVVRETLAFVGVDASLALAPVTRENEMPHARYPRVQRALEGKGRTGRAVRATLPARPRQALAGWTATHVTRRPRLDPAVRAELTAALSREISVLEELIGRDLSGWRA